MKTIIKSLCLMAALAFIPSLSWATVSDEVTTTLTGVKVDTSGNVLLKFSNIDNTSCPGESWYTLDPSDGTEITKNRMIAVAMMAQMSNATVGVKYETDESAGLSCVIRHLSASS